MLYPITRKEQFLFDLIRMKRGETVSAPTLKPITREERFLAGLLGDGCELEPLKKAERAMTCCLTKEYTAEPLTRLEHFWRSIAQKW